MEARKFFRTCRSFQDLRSLLKAKSISLPTFPPTKSITLEVEPSLESEEKLFSQAMERVKPLSAPKGGKRVFFIKTAEANLPEDIEKKEEAETLLKLTHLVQYGAGFNVSDTAEYIEGTGYNVHPELARRLHRGTYSIQAHLDLHALKVNEAKEVFENFLKRAIATGKRGILIIHGRGLSSPSGPVLKKKVQEWLTHGPWRKWVIAYSSARICDGGAGATYVLLREHPISKRWKKGGRGRSGTSGWELKETIKAILHA
jgi:DNA-nicking Smr family endonuclease